jgi:hypothetical protein
MSIEDAEPTFPFAVSLAAWFETTLCEMPEPIAAAARKVSGLVSWDDRLPEARANLAKYFDAQNDPAREVEGQQAFNREAERQLLEQERKRLELMNVTQPSEHVHRRNEFERIDRELRQLDELDRVAFAVPQSPMSAPLPDWEIAAMAPVAEKPEPWPAFGLMGDEGASIQSPAVPAAVSQERTTASSDGSSGHWKMRIQEEAAKEWRRLRKLSCNPTRASIRPHLLQWCKANGVKTPLGVNPSDGYLRTHVLSGGHWTPPEDC